MANQVVEGLSAELDLLLIDIGDYGIVVDGDGEPTGQIRLGVGSQLGGFLISGAVGSGAVGSVNGQTGAVTLGLGDLDDVDLGDAPAIGDVLGWDGADWVSTGFIGTLAGLTDLELTLPLKDGQSIRWSTAEGKWINYIPSGGSGSDNLGNHTATLDLNLADHEITNVASLNLTNSWEVLDSVGGTLILQKAGSPSFTLQHTTTPGAGYLALPDYGSSRTDDSATVSLDNLAYFGTNGILRKANRATNINAFKVIPADAFGKLSGLAAAATGQALIYNGTNFVPAAIPSTGATTFLGLTDTPDNYTGHSLKSLRVNTGSGGNGTAIEFFTPTAPSFLNIAETPDSFATHALKHVRVNAGATAVEFAAATLLGSADIQTGTPTGGQSLVWNTGLSRFDFVTALVTDFTDPVAVGSLMYFDGTSWIDIPPRTNGDVLTMVGGVPAWA